MCATANCSLLPTTGHYLDARCASAASKTIPENIEKIIFARAVRCGWFGVSDGRWCDERKRSCCAASLLTTGPPSLAHQTIEKPARSWNSDGLSWSKTRSLVQGHRGQMLTPDFGSAPQIWISKFVQDQIIPPAQCPICLRLSESSRPVTGPPNKENEDRKQSNDDKHPVLDFKPQEAEILDKEVHRASPIFVQGNVFSAINILFLYSMRSWMFAPISTVRTRKMMLASPRLALARTLSRLPRPTSQAVPSSGVVRT